MLAAHSVRTIPFEPPREEIRNDAVTLLGEIVAQLAERVELLEARERIGRAAYARSEAGTVKARE